MSILDQSVFDELVAEGMPPGADHVMQMQWLRKVHSRRDRDREARLAIVHSAIDEMEDTAFDAAKRVVDTMSDEKIAREFTPRVALEHVLAQRIVVQSMQKRVAVIGGRHDRICALDKLWESYLAEGAQEDKKGG